jgi:hypothetical protein
MASLFGFEIKRKKQLDNENVSFTPKETDDGAVVVAAGGSYGTYVDLDGTVRTESELVSKYREMTLQPEIDMAVDEIVNEAIVVEKNKDIVTIILDDLTEVNSAIKNAITVEFKESMRLLEFSTHAYHIFRRWYVDGRLYYHAITDEKNMQLGIKELRYIDPRKIRKVREVAKKRLVDAGDVSLTKTVQEYYLYNDRGFNVGNKTVVSPNSGLKIGADSIVHVTSGLTDTNGTMVLSYMHKAIKPLNQLRSLEDATVIYRLSRAPERRIFYIDVGNLPKMKAEQYLRDMMVKYKNRLIYDAATGEVRDDRKFMTMLEDFWLPRREGGKGTEIQTLPGGQNLGEIADVEYFQKKLYNSLNIPTNRLDNSDNIFTSRSTEITRDELKFSKFITRLRQNFNQLFIKILEKQLILKGIVTYDDWVYIAPKIQFDYAMDNYFSEIKESEMINGRINTLNMVAPYIGKYYSNEWVMKNVLRMSEEDIMEMFNQIQQEASNPILNPTQMLGPDDMSGMGGAAPKAPKEPKKRRDLKDAEQVYDKLKDKQNRKPHEDRELRSAAQKIGRSIVKQPRR